jgi:uncharacterized protein
MELLEKYLEVKKSTIPGAGKGLFTKVKIEKGTRILQYTGTITTWKDVDHVNGTNPYIYYVNRNHVIDARKHPKALGRYANDARGLQRQKGINNNADYVRDGLNIYIQAVRNIPAGGEILVSYGKEYWDVIKKNKGIDNEPNAE